MKYGNRSPWKKFISSPITAAIAFIIFGVTSNATWKVHEKAVASLDKLNESKVSLQALQSRQEDLSRKVDYLSTDEGIKSEIRNKFRATENGESVAVIIDTDRNTTTTPTTTPVKRTWWDRLLGVVGF